GGMKADQLSHRIVAGTARAVCDSERHPRTFAWPNGVTVIVKSKVVSMSVSRRKSWNRVIAKRSGD
ncbi:MAG TPA: hypothetical protein VG711_09255, partial [Phycisphaerales bacterium]|nr:hypothetical protein [Phycisphaerales bacterium]